MKKLKEYLIRKITRLNYKIIQIIYILTPNELKKSHLDSRNYLEQKLRAESDKEVFDVFKEDLKKSIRFNDDNSIRKYAINLALENEAKLKENLYYLEFGVYKGRSANFISKFVRKLYVFDSFQGLSEEWQGSLPKSYFDLKGKVPPLNRNIEPIVGLVENTIDNFLDKHNPKINFVHLDLDLYRPTKFTLEKIKPYLVKGSIILFDELYNYINWKEGEYKALTEILESSEYVYRAFNITGMQAVIQIL